jgi:ABC-type Fe3+-hydroxamate transport system substrate-binding protein
MSVSGLRVVSLVPSSTETLLALGANVVACTRFCEQPTIPPVGGTKNPDVGSIVRLAPDLVVMDREETDARMLMRLGERGSTSTSAMSRPFPMQRQWWSSWHR